MDWLITTSIIATVIPLVVLFVTLCITDGEATHMFAPCLVISGIVALLFFGVFCGAVSRTTKVTQELPLSVMGDDKILVVVDNERKVRKTTDASFVNGFKEGKKIVLEITTSYNTYGGLVNRWKQIVMLEKDQPLEKQP